MLEVTVCRLLVLYVHEEELLDKKTLNQNKSVLINVPLSSYTLSATSSSSSSTAAECVFILNIPALVLLLLVFSWKENFYLCLLSSLVRLDVVCGHSGAVTASTQAGLLLRDCMTLTTVQT